MKKKTTQTRVITRGTMVIKIIFLIGTIIGSITGILFMFKNTEVALICTVFALVCIIGLKIEILEEEVKTLTDNALEKNGKD